MMLWQDMTVVRYHGDGFHVQWVWDPQSTDPDTVEMEIERSGSPTGPFDLLATFDPRTQFSFFDKTTPWRPANEEFYWRLRAVDKSTGAEVGVSYAFGLNGELPLDALEIIRQQRVLLEGVNGHKPIKGIPGLVTVYRRRNFGSRCPECVDSITDQVHVSNCLVCDGTGTLRGYYNPVDIGMNIMPYSAAVRPFKLQKTEDCDTVGTTVNWPAMYPGDIVVEPNEKHWRVTKIEVKERHRILVTQILYLTQVKPDDIIHSTLRHSSHGGRQ